MTVAEGYVVTLTPAHTAASGRTTRWHVQIDCFRLRESYTLKDALGMVKAYIEKRDRERAQEG